MQFIKVNWVKFQEEKIPKLGEGRAEVFQAGWKEEEEGPDLFPNYRIWILQRQEKKVRYTEVEKRRDKEDVKYNKE